MKDEIFTKTLYEKIEPSAEGSKIIAKQVLDI